MPRLHCHHPLILLVAVPLLAAPGSGQCRELRFPGQAGLDGFGTAVAGVGDVDGDGVPDLAVGAVQDLAGGPGYVQVLSGADGALLHEFRGSSPWARFGKAVAGAGDVDRDGRLLRQWDGDQAGGALGWTLAGTGDLDGDGVPDFAAGEPGNNQNGGANGALHLYSGRTGQRLYSFLGQVRDSLGVAVARAGDVDGDGLDDVIVGAPREDGSLAPNTGGAWVISGANGMPIHHWQGWALDDSFGVAVAGVGDWDGDGHADVAVGAPGAFDLGVVIVVSGQTGQNLAWLRGESPLDGFGSVLAGGRDVDGDGLPDLLVGMPGSDGAGPAAGAAVVHAAPWGERILRLAGDHAGAILGAAVALPGDLDRDGRGEVLLGAPMDDSLAPAAGSAVLAFCGALVLDPPAPGLAGRDNLLVARAATGGATVHFLWSLQLGSTRLPGCRVVLDLAAPQVAGLASAGADGIARLTVPVPASAAGRLLVLQAAETASCRVSLPVLHRFR